MRLFEETLKDIQKRQDQFDFVFLLGDNYGHNYFRDPDESQLVEMNQYFYSKIKEVFGGKIVIPVLGNHESHPVNSYDFDDGNNYVVKNILPNFLQFIQ